MIDLKLIEIFKNGSKTYFYSSLFFPSEKREDVFKLYAFVRIADDYVDTIPQKEKEFNEFVKEYKRANTFGSSKNTVINSFIEVKEKYHIPDSWIESFLSAMKSDLSKNEYKTHKELESYMYGSAEVIGLCMASILELSGDAYPAAQMLGKSMQLANFIRDMDEDTKLGRTYIPNVTRQKYGFAKLDYVSVFANRHEFVKLVRDEISIFQKWQKEAEKGFIHIPYRYLVPVKTASDMYKWTLRRIYEDPLLIFCKKVKPPMYRIFFQILLNAISIPFTKRVALKNMKVFRYKYPDEQDL